MIYDSIVIGKGPAGVTTAIYLKRYGYEPLIIAKDGGALAQVKEIENYYGFSKITGPELLERGIEQAKDFQIPILEEEVLEITYESVFMVTTTKGIYQAKTVVLACGISKNRFNKADKYEGVSYCATCDGFFYRKKKLALIGSSSYMAHELSVLENITKDITIFTDGAELTTAISQDFPIVLDKIEEIQGEERITGIKAGGTLYPVDGCFVAIGNASGFTLAKHLGIALKNNSIVVDENYMTNLDGLFACGDAIGGLLQVSKAIGDGASCATAIFSYLKKHNS